MFTIVLLLILLLCGLYFLCATFAGRSKYGHHSGTFFPAQRSMALVAASVLLLVWCAWFYTGRPDSIAATIPLEARSRVELRGWFSAEGNGLSFLGSLRSDAGTGPADDPLRAQSAALAVSPGSAGMVDVGKVLPDGVRLDIYPDPSSVNRATGIAPTGRWRVRLAHGNEPLRYHGHLLNPQVRWLTPGDGTLILMRGGTRDKASSSFVSLHLAAPAGGILASLRHVFAKTQDDWVYNQGTFAGGKFKYDFASSSADPAKDGVRLPSLANVQEGLSLTDLARREPRLWKEQGRSKCELTLREWQETLSSVWIVRENTDNEKPSRLGVLVAPDAGDSASWSATFNGERILAPATAWDVPLEAVGQTGPALLTYGLGGGAFELQVPQAATIVPNFGGRKSEARLLDFSLPSPRSWPLPPQEGQQPLILTSSSEYVPLSGYFFPTGSTQNPFFAKAHLNSDWASWRVAGSLSGWPQNSGNTDSTGEQVAKLGESVRLGSHSLGVIVALNRLQPKLRNAGNWAILALIFAGLLAAYSLWLERRWGNEEGRHGATDAAFHIIYVCALALLTVRFVLAYRVNLLPPPDATVRELRDVFNKPLAFALIALLAVPFSMLGSRTTHFWVRSGRGWLAPLAFWFFLGPLLLVLVAWFKSWPHIPWLSLAFAAPLMGFCAIILWLEATLERRQARLRWHRERGEVEPAWPAKIQRWHDAREQWVQGFGCAIAGRHQPGEGNTAADLNPATAGQRLWPSPQLLAGALGLFLALFILSGLVGDRLNLDGKMWLRLAFCGGVTIICVGPARCRFWLLPLGFCLLAAATGGNSSLLGRPNLFTWSFICVALAFVQPLNHYLTRWAVFGHGFCGWFVMAVLLAVTKDTGSALLILPLALGLFTLRLGQRETRGRSTLLSWTICGVVCMAVLAVLLAPRQAPLVNALEKWSLTRTASYRLVTQNEGIEARLMQTRYSGQQDLDLLVRELLRNGEQRWQMLLYAGQGKEVDPPQAPRLGRPRYGLLPASDVGMTYGTTVSDCVFSIFLLSEHGFVVGALVLGLYLTLGCAMLWGASRLPDDWARRRPALIAAALFYVIYSFYMAAANAGMVVFTGQNMPLLGLTSGADVAQSAVLLSLAAYILSPRREAENEPSAEVALTRGLAVTAGLWWLVITIAFLRFPRGTHDGDYQLGKSLRDSVENHLPQDDEATGESSTKKMSPLRLIMGGDKPAIDETTGLSDFERRWANEFNNRTAEEQSDPNDHLFFVRSLGGASMSQKSAENYRLDFGWNKFQVRSPFKTPAVWRGAIFAAGQGKADPTVIALGRPFSLSLTESGFAKSVVLSNRAQLSPFEFLEERKDNQVEVLEGGTNAKMGTLSRLGDKVSLRAAMIPGQKVTLDGKDVVKDTTGRDLQDNSIIDWETENGKRYSLLYVGRRYPVLAYSMWRNGQAVTVYPGAKVFPLTYAIASAAKNKPLAGQGQYLLSLDIDLHTRLQSMMEEWARSQPDYRVSSQEQGNSRRKDLALTVMDTFSGEVRALPSYPLTDPTSRDFEESESNPARVSRLLKNHNLGNHGVGSTIKPLSLAGMATQLYGVDVGPYNTSSKRWFDPATMKVLEWGKPQGRGRVYNSMGGISIHDTAPYPAAKTGEPTDMRQCFIQSLNWPQCTLGTLGLLRDAADLPRALVLPRSHVDVVINGLPRSIDLTNVHCGVTATGTIVSANIERSLFLRGLYQVLGSPLGSSPMGVRKIDAYRWLPSLVDPGHQGAPPAKLLFSADDVLPDKVLFDPREMGDLDGSYRTMLVGSGAYGRFNNVRMAEAMSRLATGNKILATLEKQHVSGQKTAAPALEPMPHPLGPGPEGQKWRNDSILGPMFGAGHNPNGTVNYLEGKTGSYVGIFKSGTVNEFDKRNGRSSNSLDSECLMFVVGQFTGQLGSNGQVLRPGNFVKGKTVTCYLYMGKSSRSEQELRKKVFVKKLMPIIVGYLDKISPQ